MAATPPQWIGRCRVHEVIGVGAFATVYRASDEHLNVDVAVKVLSGKGENEPVAPNENEDGSDNPEGRALNRRVEITYPS